jgi:hypothetical protein
MDELTDPIFNRYLMDLGANVLVVVILIVAVYFSRRAAPTIVNEGAETVHRTVVNGENAWSCSR